MDCKRIGFDAVINYKSHDLDAQLAKHTADGIDLYFENTGGSIQILIVERMNAHGCVKVCGLIADDDKQVDCQTININKAFGIFNSP